MESSRALRSQKRQNASIENKSPTKTKRTRKTATPSKEQKGSSLKANEENKGLFKSNKLKVTSSELKKVGEVESSKVIVVENENNEEKPLTRSRRATRGKNVSSQSSGEVMKTLSEQKNTDSPEQESEAGKLEDPKKIVALAIAESDEAVTKSLSCAVEDEDNAISNKTIKNVSNKKNNPQNHQQLDAPGHREDHILQSSEDLEFNLSDKTNATVVDTEDSKKNTSHILKEMEEMSSQGSAQASTERILHNTEHKNHFPITNLIENEIMPDDSKNTKGISGHTPETKRLTCTEESGQTNLCEEVTLNNQNPEMLSGKQLSISSEDLKKSSDKPLSLNENKEHLYQKNSSESISENIHDLPKEVTLDPESEFEHCNEKIIHSSSNNVLNEKKEDDYVIDKVKIHKVNATSITNDNVLHEELTENQNRPKEHNSNVEEENIENDECLQDSDDMYVEDVLNEIEESLNLLTRSPTRHSSRSRTNCSSVKESEKLPEDTKLTSELTDTEGSPPIKLGDTEEEDVEKLKEKINLLDQNNSTSKEGLTRPWDRKNKSKTESFISPNQANTSTVTIVKKEVSITYEVSNFSHCVESTESKWGVNQIASINDLHSDNVLELSSQEVKREMFVESSDEDNVKTHTDSDIGSPIPISDTEEVSSVKTSEKRSKQMDEKDTKRFKPDDESQTLSIIEASDKVTPAVTPDSVKSIPKPLPECGDPWVSRLPPPPGEDDVILPPPLDDTAEDMDLQDDDEDSAPAVQNEKQVPEVKLMSGIVKVSPGQFETDYVINDLSNTTRTHILLVGLARNEISKASGVAVYSRGKFLDPANKHPVNETPLHLHIEGPTRKSVEYALEVIEKLKSKVDEPEDLLVEKVVVGWNAAPSLEMVRIHVLGAGEQNLRFIQEETNARVTLHGWGSGVLESNTNQEAPEPMHLRIEHTDPVKLMEARKLAEHLVFSIQGEVSAQAQPLMMFPPQPIIPMVQQMLPMTPMVYEALPILHALPRPTLPSQSAVGTTKAAPQPVKPPPNKPALPISKSLPTVISVPKTTIAPVPPPLLNPPTAPPRIVLPSTLNRAPPSPVKAPPPRPVNEQPPLLRLPSKPKIGSRFSSVPNPPLQNKQVVGSEASTQFKKPNVLVTTAQTVKKPIKKIEFSIITASKKGGVHSSTTFTTEAKKPSNSASKFSPSIVPPSTLAGTTPTTSSLPVQMTSAAQKASYANSKLIQVMNLLLKALELQISTMSAGSQRDQLQQIFLLLQKALPQQSDAVVTPQQRAQLQTIITLLEKGLQTITSGDPPTQLIKIMQLLRKVLETPQSSLGQGTSPNSQSVPRVPLFTPQTTQGSLQQFSKVVITQPPPLVQVPSNTQLQPQGQQRGFTQKPVFPNVQGSIQQTQTTFTVRQTFSSSSGGVQTPTQQSVVPSPTFASQPQTLAPASGVQQPSQVDNQRGCFSANTQQSVQKPNQLGLMMQLLQAALQSHANNMAEGASKQLVMQIARMLQESFEDRESHGKLVETLHLLEQALKMPSFATSSQQQPTQLAQILQLVQQALKSEPQRVQTNLQPLENTITGNTYSTPALQQMQNPFTNVSTVQQATFSNAPTVQQAQLLSLFQQPTPALQSASQMLALQQLIQALQPVQQQSALAIMQQMQPGNILLSNLAQLLQQQQQTQLVFPQQSQPLLHPGNPLLAQLAQSPQTQQSAFNKVTTDVPKNNEQSQLLQLAQQLQTKVKAMAADAMPKQSQHASNALEQSKVSELTQEIQKFNELLQKGLQKPPDPPTAINAFPQVSVQKISEQAAAAAAVQNDEETIVKHVTEESSPAEYTELSITSVPKVEDSLSSSLAYIFFGPFQTVTLLTKAGTDLRQRVVKYIRDHKHIFFKVLTSYYNKEFTNHGLDPQMAFEHCCVKLAHPDHAPVHEMLFAVATMFKTPILILYEDGRPSQKVDPYQQCSAAAVNILSRKNNTFAPVDKIISEGKSQTLQRFFPLSTSSSKPSLLVATWQVNGSKREQPCDHNRVDECLASRRVDLACLQAFKLNTGGKQKLSETPHYDWYGAGSLLTDKSLVILVRKNSGVVITNFLPVSKTVVTANILFFGVTYSLIGAYLQDSTGKFHAEGIYNVQNAIDQAPKLSQILLLGNFNACIGTSDIRKIDREFVGHNLRHKESNRNGVILLSWLKTHQLKLLTSFPYETPESKVTCKVGNESSQVSHILTPLLPHKRIRNFLWWESCSDHAIIASNIEDGSTISSESVNLPLTIVTWNVVSSVSETQRDAIDKALLNHKVDLACMQGTHLSDCQLDTENYNWWCTGAKKETYSFGICFLLRKNGRASLENVVAHTDQVASARLLLPGLEIAIIGCDLPVGNMTQQIYCDILQVANQVPPTVKLLILGNFNATIGSKSISTSERHLISESGTHKNVDSNRNGRLLKNLAILYDLYICSTFVKVGNASPPCSHILFQDQLPDGTASVWKPNFSTFPMVAVNIPTEP